MVLALFKRKWSHLPYSFRQISRLCLLLSLLSLPLLYVMTSVLARSQTKSTTIAKNMDDKQCRIPVVPLYPSAYNQTVFVNGHNPNLSSCTENSLRLTQLFDNGTLRLRRSDIYRREECTAFEVLRPVKLSNDRHQLRQLAAFDTRNEIHGLTEDYVMVACGSTSIEYSYHERILPYSEPLLAKARYWEDEKVNLPPNIVLLVLDSISANEASRQLPKTLDFLHNQLDFIQFTKYHGLGEPTMLNVLPLLTGISAQKLFKERIWSDYWDDTDFIWKAFGEANYVTAYMEDIPNIGTWNYGLQNGFLHAPTDIYPRSLLTAWELNKKAINNCIGDTSLWKFLLDYELEILTSLDGIAPSFTIPWLAWPFHDYFGSLNLLDNDLLSFFQNLATSKSVFENTLIILMADHGFYQHPYAQSHAGLIERRLPLFLIRIPQKLIDGMSNLTNILRDNSNRVTSHYDVYETLVDLSAFGRARHRNLRTDPGLSLFQPIPEGRTCREAGIPDTWCACNLPDPPNNDENDSKFLSTVQVEVESFHMERLWDWFTR